MGGYDNLIAQYNRQTDWKRQQNESKQASIAQLLTAIGSAGAETINGIQDRNAWDEFSKSLPQDHPDAPAADAAESAVASSVGGMAGGPAGALAAPAGAAGLAPPPPPPADGGPQMPPVPGMGAPPPDPSRISMSAGAGGNPVQDHIDALSASTGNPDLAATYKPLPQDVPPPDDSIRLPPGVPGNMPNSPGPVPMAPPQAPPAAAARPMTLAPHMTPPPAPRNYNAAYKAIGRMRPEMARRAESVLGNETRDAGLVSREKMLGVTQQGLSDRAGLLDQERRDLEMSREAERRYGTDTRDNRAAAGQGITEKLGEGRISMGLSGQANQKDIATGHDTTNAAIGAAHDATSIENVDAKNASAEGIAGAKLTRQQAVDANVQRAREQRTAAQTELDHARTAEALGKAGAGAKDRVVRKYAPIVKQIETAITKNLTDPQSLPDDDPNIIELHQELDKFKALLDGANGTGTDGTSIPMQHGTMVKQPNGKWVLQ